MTTTMPISAAAWKVGTALALGLSLISLAVPRPSLSQEKLLRTLTVTGQGKEMVATTITQVRLGVEAEGETAKGVQAEVARRSNSVVELLRSRQVEKLETTGISLEPNYRYNEGNRTLIGYVARNLVSFRVPTQQAGTILDDAVKAGASRIDGVSFVAADAVIATAQKTALREATQDAQAQADAVLDSLGLSRQEIVGIQVNGAFAPPPRPVEAAKFTQDAAAMPSPVIGGDQEVNASVTLQIRY